MSADESPSNPLLGWYTRYIGEPETTRDVYVGFGLFFGGIIFGAIGVVLFLAAASFEAGTDPFWAMRRLSVVLASVGLPAVMLGIVVLLPVSDRALGAAIVGSIICLLAMGVFAASYPSNWNVRRGADYSVHGVAIYAVGLAIVSASTAAALIGHHLERAAPTTIDPERLEALEREAERAEADDDGAAISEERVRRDIEEAMRDVEFSWGGIRKARTRRLEVRIDEGDIDRSGFEDVEATTTRRTSSDVEDAVSGLKRLRGGNVEQATGEGIDDQAAALSELRAQKRAEALATDDRGTLDRLRERFDRFVGDR